MTNSALVFARSDTVLYGGSISGSGAVTQAGSGALVLNGNSRTFSGTTTIASGTLEWATPAMPPQPSAAMWR